MANNVLATRIVLKNDTLENWTASTLVLLKGEAALVTDTRKIKYGDGVNTFANLQYATMTPEEVNTLVNSAVQTVVLSGGTDNGTMAITVNGTKTNNVAVTGLKSAAYTAASDYASAAQGSKADSAVQSVFVATGKTNGTVGFSVNGAIATDVPVYGLGSAAYTATTAYATAAQGTKADSAVQTAVLGSGTDNGTLAITVNGTKTDNVAVTGLKSAAYTESSAYATAAQGAKANSAVQSVSVATGKTNGTVNVSVNGAEATAVPVYGLKSAAYTESTAYATAAQGTKADNAMPKSGGTFTGDVILNGAPTVDLQATTKLYVDSQIASSIQAADSMTLKGTLGTGGTITALPTTNVKIGDTYKTITAGTVDATHSSAGANVAYKVGDLVVAMSTTPTWLVVPSGDEEVTTVKYSTSTTNLTTAEQTGSVVLGEAAAKQIDSTIAAASTSTKLPTSAAVATFVEGKGYVTPTGTVAKADALTTGRTIAISGAVTGTATSFNGSADITIPVTAINTDYIRNGSNTLVLDCGSAT